MDVLSVSAEGLSCEVGGFVVDPWQPVETAVITHAHADHARPGSQRYLCTPETVPILRHRLGEETVIEPLAFGEERVFGDTTLSLHPAGHVLGSAQVKVVHAGETWVVTGDFKRRADPTCRPFEVVPCDVLITEATFALPIYRWEPTEAVIDGIMAWWQRCRDANRPAVLGCYAFGKSQRLLAEIGARTDQPVYVHGAVEVLTRLYRDQGVAMAPTLPVQAQPKGTKYGGELILAPPGAMASRWMKRFKNHSTALASGWMRVRGNRRWRGYDRGFVLSDHADWTGLLDTVAQSGARRIKVTHGSTHVLARYLREVRWLDAVALETAYEGEAES